ncbi:trypsin-3-like [Phymastichus coffea]|uniref:trypsin-3-like n=1 Tax=Phymastichus coffea TaxID=108790 RepID=UPI00273CA3EF|nr:trypsin-3-like [Phymastichus coffea]
MLRFVVLLACLGASLARPQKRLAGDAFAVEIDKFPYQVSVYSFGNYRCSGAIISEDYVLTSVHCAAFARDALTVRAGSAQLGVAGSLHNVSEIIEHDHYGSNIKRHNDVALLRLEPKLEFDETKQPIPLTGAKVSLTEGDKGVISGWGTTGDRNLRGDIRLFAAVSVNVMSLLDCVEIYYSRFGNLSPGALCAKNERPGGAACSVIWSADDSGSPLVVDGKLAGIFSWGYKCDSPGFPSVFMEVAYYRDWIKKNSGV